MTPPQQGSDAVNLKEKKKREKKRGIHVIFRTMHRYNHDYISTTRDSEASIGSRQTIYIQLFADYSSLSTINNQIACPGRIRVDAIQQVVFITALEPTSKPWMVNGHIIYILECIKLHNAHTSSTIVSRTRDEEPGVCLAKATLPGWHWHEV